METFDIYSDIYSDPELKLLFKSEYDANVPSSTIWALILYVHPKSKFAGLSFDVKADLIRTDYLEDPSFDFSAYPETSDKIKEFILTPPERLLASWNNKLSERDKFMESIPYSPSSYEMLDKMMKDTFQMKKQYREIYNDFIKQQEHTTMGAIDESLSEKGII